jgi:type II secretory pathway pseudopilin PulG
MKKVLILIGLVALGFGGFWVVRAVTTVQANARMSKLNEDVENLFTALQQYKENVGTYPSGGNADIAKALQGKNPKNVIILVGRKSPTNDKGEFVDPWGVPLRIYFSDSGVLIRSAGSNRRFDDSTVMEADDYLRSN